MFPLVRLVTYSLIGIDAQVMAFRCAATYTHDR
jgi:hypothetical protein